MLTFRCYLRRCFTHTAAASPVLLVSITAHAAVTLPDETFASPKQLQAVRLDIQQQSYASAVDRMQDLMDKHGTELCRTDDDRLMAVDQFFATMPDADRAAVQGAYEAKLGAIAEQARARILGKPTFRPQDLYGIAKRFPFTKAAGVALAGAGDRAAEQGDLASARELYSLAARHGWHGDAAEQARIAEITPATSSAPDGAFGPAGPLPFDAPWFNLPTGFERDKIFPVGSGDLSFIAAAHSVFALRIDGTIAWRWQETNKAESSPPRFQPGSTGRGRLAMPAMLPDASGHAAIVVVAQPASGNGSGTLTAFRADDGRLLWSTAGEPLLRSTVFLGSPAVAGRYVITVGLETTSSDASTAALQLIAVDVTSGHLLWRTQLAGINTNQGTRDLDLYRDQSRPAIAGDCVLVSPNIGAVFAVDRFDGELRWIRRYRQAVIADSAIRKYVNQRQRGRDLIAPLAWTDLLRWHCTPQIAGDIAIAAPQDTVAVMGLDRMTGKMLWESGNLPQATPVGVAGGKVILSGASLTAIDPKTGLKTWTFTPVPGVRLTGPAVVRDGEILVRSTAGLLAVSAADSSSSPSERTTDFHPAAASEAGKAALAGAGISEAFGIPPARNGQ